MQEAVNDQRSQEGEGMRSDVSHSPSGSRQEGVKQLSVTMVISALPSITRVTVAAVGGGSQTERGANELHRYEVCGKRAGEACQRSGGRKENGRVASVGEGGAAEAKG